MANNRLLWTLICCSVATIVLANEQPPEVGSVNCHWYTLFVLSMFFPFFLLSFFIAPTLCFSSPSTRRLSNCSTLIITVTQMTTRWKLKPRPIRPRSPIQTVVIMDSRHQDTHGQQILDLDTRPHHHRHLHRTYEFNDFCRLQRCRLNCVMICYRLKRKKRKN